MRKLKLTILTLLWIISICIAGAEHSDETMQVIGCTAGIVSFSLASFCLSAELRK